LRNNVRTETMPVTSDLAANLIESAKSPQCNSFSAWVKSPCQATSNRRLKMVVTNFWA